MGWERRQRGGLYYTRSRKVGGRVVREYVGVGLLGILAAEQDAARRGERHARTAAWWAERAQVETVDTQVNDLCDAVETLARGVLMLAGYRRHHRGQWRKEREHGLCTDG